MEVGTIDVSVLFCFGSFLSFSMFVFAFSLFGDVNHIFHSAMSVFIFCFVIIDLHLHLRYAVMMKNSITIYGEEVLIKKKKKMVM